MSGSDVNVTIGDGEDFAVIPLPGGGVGFIPREPQPLCVEGELGDEWVDIGYVDRTRGV